MHDYFDILGVAPGARASEIRQACARHASRPHPDFREAAGRNPELGRDLMAWQDAAWSEVVDVAVDFPNVPSLLERARAAFFRSGQ